MENARDVSEIQEDLAQLVEELAAIRPRLRHLREEAAQTPSYKLSVQHTDGADPEETQGFYLEGGIAEAISKFDEFVRALLEAAWLEWEEADHDALRQTTTPLAGPPPRPRV